MRAYFSKHHVVNSAPSPLPEIYTRRRRAAADVSSELTIIIEVEPNPLVVDIAGNGAVLITDISSRTANISSRLHAFSAGPLMANPLMALFVAELSLELGVNPSSLNVTFDAASITVTLPSERAMPVPAVSVHSSMSFATIIGITVGVLTVLAASGLAGKVVYDAKVAKAMRAIVAAAMKESPPPSTTTTSPQLSASVASPSAFVIRLHALPKGGRIRAPGSICYRSFASVNPLPANSPNSHNASNPTIIAVNSPSHRAAVHTARVDEPPAAHNAWVGPLEEQNRTLRPRISICGDSEFIYSNDDDEKSPKSLPGTSMAQEQEDSGVDDDATAAAYVDGDTETNAWVAELIATSAVAQSLPPRPDFSPKRLPGLDMDFVSNLVNTSAAAASRTHWTVPSKRAIVLNENLLLPTPRSSVEAKGTCELNNSPHARLERRVSSKTLKWVVSTPPHGVPVHISSPTARASLCSPRAIDAILQQAATFVSESAIDSEPPSLFSINPNIINGNHHPDGQPLPASRSPSPLFTLTHLSMPRVTDKESQHPEKNVSPTRVEPAKPVSREPSPLFTRSALPKANAADTALKTAAAVNPQPLDLSSIRKHWPVLPIALPPQISIRSINYEMLGSITPAPLPPLRAPNFPRPAIPQIPFAVGAQRMLMRLTQMRLPPAALPPGSPPGSGCQETPSLMVPRSSVRTLSAARRALVAKRSADNEAPTPPALAIVTAIYSAPVVPFRVPPRGLALYGSGIDEGGGLDLGRTYRRRNSPLSGRPASVSSTSSLSRAASPIFSGGISSPRFPLSAPSIFIRPLKITRLTPLPSSSRNLDSVGGVTRMTPLAISSNLKVGSASSSPSPPRKGLALFPSGVVSQRTTIRRLLHAVDHGSAEMRVEEPTAETIEANSLLASLQTQLDKSRLSRERERGKD